MHQSFINLSLQQVYLEFTNFDDGMYINADDTDDELTTDDIEILTATNEA